MEVVMLVSTAVLAAVTSLAGIYLASRAADPVQRYRLAMWALAAAPVSLLVCGAALLQRSPVAASFCADCSGGTLSSLILSLGVGALVAALAVGLARVALAQSSLRRRLSPAPRELQERADRLAALARGRRVPVLLLESDAPAAFVLGLIRPRVVLSTWIVKHLDREELDAALAHELAHSLAHDCRTLWLATMLRDASFFLPWVWRARTDVASSRELLADEMAVTLTGRPLALASAIAKVWQWSLAEPAFHTEAAVGLSTIGAGLDLRIERLLGATNTQRARPVSPLGRVPLAGRLPLASRLVMLSLVLMLLCAAL